MFSPTHRTVDAIRSPPIPGQRVAQRTPCMASSPGQRRACKPVHNLEASCSYLSKSAFGAASHVPSHAAIEHIVNGILATKGVQRFTCAVASPRSGRSGAELTRHPDLLTPFKFALLPAHICSRSNNR
jgi:hypothetical protein